MMPCWRWGLCRHAQAAPAAPSPEAAEGFLGFNSNAPGGRGAPMTREHDVFFSSSGLDLRAVSSAGC